MWEKTPTDLWDWQTLKEKIAKSVVLRSLYVLAERGLPSHSSLAVFP